MKQLKALLNKINKKHLFTAVNCLAFMAIINSVSSTCFWDFYQPEVPESARKLAGK